jgi:hypothetical protein
MKGIRETYEVSMGKPEVNSPLGRPRRRGDNNTETILREIEVRDQQWTSDIPDMIKGAQFLEYLSKLLRKHCAP